MKLNNLVTNLISSSINKITPSRNPHEGMANKEMESQTHSPAAAPSQINKGGSEEQRFFILSMLENKKINIEEAQGLLEALEGESESISNSQYI